MDGYSISEVAERTGFPSSTLRFYERSGVVQPGRTPAGYRRYDQHHLEQLTFVRRAKGLGLSLGEITDLLALLDEDRCAPVQGRLRELVGARIADARTRATELAALTADLERVVGTLGRHTPDGPCDGACGCTTDGAARPAAPVAARTRPDPTDDPAVACTLEPARIDDRLQQWEAAYAEATDRTTIADGVRLRFPRGVDVAALAALAAAEQDCCGFFTFGLTIDHHGVALDVTGPADAQPVIEAMLGSIAG